VAAHAQLSHGGTASRLATPGSAASLARLAARIQPRDLRDSAAITAHGIRRAGTALVFARLRKEWRTFKAYPVGERFQKVHRRQQGGPPWVKPVMLAGAFVSFAIGVLLTVLPGPAVLFFALTGALLAASSAWVARQLDHAEVALRKLLKRFRRRFGKHRGDAAKHGAGT
jgi:hypothetical protein